MFFIVEVFFQLEQMELEVRELPTALRNKHQTRLKSYQSELAKLEKDLVSVLHFVIASFPLIFFYCH
jgi:hypothetical protein